jgi:predicted extracellular nuclease
MRKIAPVFGFVLLLSVLLTSCSPGEEPPIQTTATPTPTQNIPRTDHLVISEVLAGVQGNNPYDFIELYNPTLTPIDLMGFSLWYLLEEGDEETLVHVWEESALVPPLGHYLLGQEGQQFGLVSDATFNQPLVPNRGGLILQNPDRVTVDRLGWGEAPGETVEGAAAPAMENGVSLERLPGSAEGNGADFNSNAGDFTLNPSPNPQNSGSPITPAASDGELKIAVIYPESISPGTEFDLAIELENRTWRPVEELSASVTLPAALTVRNIADGLTIDGRTISWQVDYLAPGEKLSAAIQATAPWTYTTLRTHSYYAQTGNWKLSAFGPPVVTRIEGGSIPIITARELLDQEVVIEGIATMYVGGFYAGSGAKFYISDETGGAQVYVAGAGNTLNVQIGDRVRVQGFVTLYRQSIEIVPNSDAKVEILESGAGEVVPVEVSVGEAANNARSLPGALVTVEGTLARVEEFSYSYEIDMVNESGQLLTLYVDKETGINIESIQSGQRYRATGIMEVLDGNLRLYPRVQADLQRVYPETLLVLAEAAVSTTAGEEFEVTLHVFNHTKESVQDVEVALPLPRGLRVVEIQDGGEQEGQTVRWLVDEIAGGGSAKTVTLTAVISPGVSYVTFSNYQVSAPAIDFIITGEPTYTFAGGQVPVWAIQGAGFQSPYLEEFVVTEGVVTAVFPDLEGFWLQETITDRDPQTSAGVFVHTVRFEPTVVPGDWVTVGGVVREAYEQTELSVSSPNNIEVLNQGSPLPRPASLNPPANEEESQKYYEALEGMLVTLAGSALVVDPTDRYGEYALVLTASGRERLYHGEDNGIIIMADDGSTRVHENQSTLEYTVTVGDTVAGLTGPLGYSFGNYKIEPHAPPTVIPGDKSYQPLPPLEAGEFSLMTWNVENLFDFLDPHPSSPPLPTVSEYRWQVTKVAANIVASGAPTLIGLQEVENIGVLEDIAEHELLTQYGYLPVLVEGEDSRGIDVGYLVRGDQAEVLEIVQYPAPEGITSRPPLLVKVGIKGSEVVLYVLNNHFTSMSGGEAATEPRRTAQAAWNVTVMEEILAQELDAYLSVMGDLNSFYASPPIDTLRDAGLMHAFGQLPAEERYTYIYEGVSQTLDHILLTPELYALANKVVVLHTNSEFPIPTAEDESPLHKSDHDPVIVIFEAP